MSVIELTSESHLATLGAGGALLVAHFAAAWCEPCMQVTDVLNDLAKQYPGAVFVKIEAENFPTISEKYEIVAVPTLVFIKGGAAIDRVDGVNVPAIAKKVAEHSPAASTAAATPSDASASAGDAKAALTERLKKLTTAARVMLFMKGTPDTPRCGFSRQIVDILKQHKTDFSAFDILSDDEVRQGLKEFSNWPTFPQLYVDGELVGGLDIVKELVASGELVSIVGSSE